jgi:hypothetical protein
MNRFELRGNQLVGAIGGLLAFTLTANFFPSFRAAFWGWGGVLLWGLAIGGLLGSLSYMHVLGRWVTRSSNTRLNTFVGVLLPFLVAAVMLLIWQWIF